MKTKTLQIDGLNPAPYNPRIKLQKGMKEWEDLNNSITKYGLVVPIIINERNNTVVSGHQRISAMKEQGIKEAEAIIVDLDEKEERKLNVALNKIEGKWDFEKLDELLEEMTPEEKKFTGFLNEEMPIVEEAKAEAKEQGEKPFYIYVSFDNKNDAEEWAREHGINIEERNYLEME